MSLSLCEEKDVQSSEEKAKYRVSSSYSIDGGAGKDQSWR